MQRIAITTTTFCEYDKSPLELLRKKSFEVILNPYGRQLKDVEIVKLCKGTIGIIAGTEPLSSAVLRQLNGLKVISRCGVGLDNIDMDSANKVGIKIFNTPDAPTVAVAELTIGLILNLLRKTHKVDIAIRKNKWKKLMGNLLYGKKVGIVGFGRIGKKVARLLRPFGCEISYTDPFVKNGLLGLNSLSKEELLRWADIISIHPSTKDRIIGKKELKLMKKGSWLVNVSRGGVIDELALYDYLKKGHLTGAAIDVFEQEPYNGPLKKLDNVILTPHIGSYAIEARTNMEMQAVRNLLKGLEGIK